MDANNLDKYNVDFYGPDAIRAEVSKIISLVDISWIRIRVIIICILVFLKRVFTGLPDDKPYPLSNNFTLSRDDDIVCDKPPKGPSKIIYIKHEEENQMELIKTEPLKHSKLQKSLVPKKYKVILS